MNVAIIAAAGAGMRMGGKRPKQFLELAGVPIIFHALRTFDRCDVIHQIVVVLAAGETGDFLSIAKQNGAVVDSTLPRFVFTGATPATKAVSLISILSNALPQVPAQLQREKAAARESTPRPVALFRSH